jgi:hypothetical protein
MVVGGAHPGGEDPDVLVVSDAAAGEGLEQTGPSLKRRARRGEQQ